MAVGKAGQPIQRYLEDTKLGKRKIAQMLGQESSNEAELSEENGRISIVVNIQTANNVVIKK